MKGKPGYNELKRTSKGKLQIVAGPGVKVAQEVTQSVYAVFHTALHFCR